MQQQSLALAGEDMGGRQLLQLRAVLALVEGIAGESGAGAAEDDPSDRQLMHAYARASGVAQRRYDVLAGETATFAATGIDALIRHKAVTGAEAAAGAVQLAAELRRAIMRMRAIIAA